MGKKEQTFSNFNKVNGTTSVFDAFVGLIKPDCKPFLLVYGECGNGKTHLCNALATELKKQGAYCCVTRWSDVVRRFKNSFDRPDINYHTIYNEFRNTERLIIDDVGAGGTCSEWEWGELEDIISYRYEMMLFTVLVTNKGLNELPPRIVSRFHDPDVGCIVCNRGKDYRKRWLKAVQ